MKLHIFGASGSGVTTMGEALSGILDIQYFDSDDYFWLPSDPPFSQRREAQARNRLIVNDLQKTDNWILGGSVINWGNIFPDFDLIIFLIVPPLLRIERLRNRESARYGEIIFNEPARNVKFESFIAWAADYDNNTGISNRTLQAHENWLEHVNAPVLRISGEQTVEERIRLVLAKIEALGLNRK